MPRGKSVTIDSFVKGVVRFLAAKSPDAQEIILTVIGNELKLANSGSGGKKLGKRKYTKKAKPAEGEGAQAAGAEGGNGIEQGQGQAPKKAKAKKKKRKFTKVREGKKKGAGAGAEQAPAPTGVDPIAEAGGDGEEGGEPAEA